MNKTEAIERLEYLKAKVDNLIRQTDKMIKFDEELLQMDEPQYHAEIECNYKDCENCGYKNFCPQREDEPQNHSGEATEMVEPQTEANCGRKDCPYFKNPDYTRCTNCKYEPKDEPQAGMSYMSEIDKMIKIVDGILGDDDLCEGCKYVIEGLSCDECRRKYADKIIKILQNLKHKPQTDDGTAFIKRHGLRVDCGDEVPYDLKPFIDW